MNTQLLLIDAQNDFCNPKSDLFVPGADKDAVRIATFIERNIDMLDEIRVTLDSHQHVHIAHPICWVDKDGRHPSFFTEITLENVTGKNPKWRAKNPAWQERQVDYIQKLKIGGRYTLIIWPPHCIIGTEGHALVPSISLALEKWQKQFAMMDVVTKGSNPFTEHYSVVKADVEDPTDHTTGLNFEFIERLKTAERILIAGQALSHCLANSVRDIAEEFGDDQIQKLVLLIDATSPVTGYESIANDFITEMKKKGMQIAKTTDF